MNNAFAFEMLILVPGREDGQRSQQHDAKALSISLLILRLAES